MYKTLAFAGGLMALLGAGWILEGLRVIQGSRMTGQPVWVGIGLVCVLVGPLIVYVSMRRGNLHFPRRP